MIELRGKRALVMGLGVHGGGLGVTRFLVEQGADVTVTDLRSPDQLAPTLALLEGLPVRYVLGEHRDADFRTADLVVRNPGVPRESRFLQIARAAGAVIEMEMTLFFRLCPGPIIGITGTKGKTTTTLLTGAMLKQQFPDTVIAGNLRVSALEQLSKIGPQTPVVLELSSWQLEGLGEAQLSPQYACYLNLYPDHLDRYGSMQAYGAAKAQIFLYQKPTDIAVLNADADSYSQQMPDIDELPGKQVLFAGEDVDWERDWQQQSRPTRITYWRDAVLISRSGDDWWMNNPADVVCTSADVQLVGDHNLANVAAATALAKAFGVETEHIRHAIQTFRGVPDRMEDVRTVYGVRYINDTTATTPTAAIAALHSLVAPTIVIAGGADKNLEFDGFAQALLERAKAVVLLEGTATAKLRTALELALKQSLQRAPMLVRGPFPALEPAVLAARDLSQAGDVVLLSPGCASFGMFKNEFDRGEQFRQIVQALS